MLSRWHCWWRRFVRNQVFTNISTYSTIESVVEKWSTLPKIVKQGQCFIIEDGQCILKSSHDYYYQIQMQLLVTERIFCDFVLYAENGPVSIERIYQNEHVINEIIVSCCIMEKSCCSWVVRNVCFKKFLAFHFTRD